MRCIVSSCDFTSVIDCKLNQRNIADPEPCFCSRAFSMHKENPFSMTFTKEPCPDLVMSEWSEDSWRPLSTEYTVLRLVKRMLQKA